MIKQVKGLRFKVQDSRVLLLQRIKKLKSDGVCNPVTHVLKVIGDFKSLPTSETPPKTFGAKLKAQIYPPMFGLKNLTCILCFSLISCTGNIKDTKSVDAFINKMVITHQFDEAKLNELFQSVEIKEDILKKISKPAEGMPWYKYRKIFMLSLIHI